MESFYGGRQGASFIIKKSFKYLDVSDPAYLAKHKFISVWENNGNYTFKQIDNNEYKTNTPPSSEQIMAYCLADDNYKDVWYNECCIIDTENKNNPNNGKIYRRRFPDQMWDKNHYEYLGTIVGPVAGASMLKPQSGLIEFAKIREELEGSWDGLGLSERVYKMGSNGNYVYEKNGKQVAADDKNKLVIDKDGNLVADDNGNTPTDEWGNTVYDWENGQQYVYPSIAEATLVLAEENKKGPLLYDPSFSSNDLKQLSQWPEDIGLEIFSAEVGKGLKHAIADKSKVVKKTVIPGDKDNKTSIVTQIVDPEKEDTVLDKENYEQSPEQEARLKELVVSDVKYNWFNVRKNTENNDGVVESWCYIGFEIPIPTFTVEALYKTPGTKPEVQILEGGFRDKHAFWHDIHFDIPGGVRGISVERIYTNDSKDAWDLQETEELEGEQITPKKAWTFDQIEYDVKTDTYSIKGETIEYDGSKKKEASRFSETTKKEYTTKAWFCDLRIINPKDSAEDEEWPLVFKDLTFFLGYIEEIEHVDLNTKTGHLVFKYHNEDEDPYDLRYPIDVRWDVVKGDLDVEYSYANPEVEEEKKIHEWAFTYPKTIAWKQAEDELADDTGEKDITYFTGQFDVDYTHYDNLTEEQKKECPNSGKFGYMRKVVLSEGEDEKSGTMTFVNTIDEHSQTYNFSYPKNLTFNQDQDGRYNGSWDIDYYGAEDISGQFGFVKSVEMSEGELEQHGTITFKNTIDDYKNVFDFSYPKTFTLDNETGVWNVDYYGAEDTSGQIDFVDKAFIDSDTGKITFHHTKVTEGVTDTDGNFIQDFIYPKLFDLDPDTGAYTIYYSNENSNTFDQLIFPKTVSIDKNGVFSYVDSAGNTNKQTEKIVFIDDVFVDNAHQLWIAYTDNTKMENQGIEIGTPLDKNGVPLENGKTYINYGQTLGKLGVESSLITGPDKETILAQFESTYPLGVKDGEVTGQLFVVTTSDSKNPISYFVMWNPDARKWEIVSEIAGSPIGVPAQIGSDSDSWTYQDSLLLADGHVRFVTEQVVALSEEELTAENPVYWK